MSDGGYFIPGKMDLFSLVLEKDFGYLYPLSDKTVYPFCRIKNVKKHSENMNGVEKSVILGLLFILPDSAYLPAYEKKIEKN